MFNAHVLKAGCDFCLSEYILEYVFIREWKSHRRAWSIHIGPRADNREQTGLSYTFCRRQPVVPTKNPLQPKFANQRPPAELGVRGRPLEGAGALLRWWSLICRKSGKSHNLYADERKVFPRIWSYGTVLWFGISINNMLLGVLSDGNGWDG